MAGPASAPPDAGVKRTSADVEADDAALDGGAMPEWLPGGLYMLCEYVLDARPVDLNAHWNDLLHTLPNSLYSAQLARVHIPNSSTVITFTSDGHTHMYSNEGEADAVDGARRVAKWIRAFTYTTPEGETVQPYANMRMGGLRTVSATYWMRMPERLNIYKFKQHMRKVLGNRADDFRRLEQYLRLQLPWGEVNVSESGIIHVKIVHAGRAHKELHDQATTFVEEKVVPVYRVCTRDAFIKMIAR